MLVCGHCGKLSLFAGGTTSPVDFSIAVPTVESTNTLVYIPFWLVSADVAVSHEKILGGGFTRMVKGQEQMRGNQTFYICAADSIPEKYSRTWNMELTLKQPDITCVSEFKNGNRVVMTMDKETAEDNAEFIFLRYEAEIPGTLQELEYDFRVNKTKVLYLPAYKTSNTYQLGV